MRDLYNEIDVSELVGKTLTAVSGAVGDDSITFVCKDGSEYQLFHSQDCCESVAVEDICGDFADLIGTPILMAESITNHDHPLTGSVHSETLMKAKFLQGSKLPEVCDYESESFTWTFYKFRTIKGSVDIRWYGTSNGYYSECVSFQRTKTGGE